MRCTPRRFHPLFLLPLLVLAPACDTIFGPDEDPARIEISSSRSTLGLLGDTVQLTAVVKTSGGDVLRNANVFWLSRTPTVTGVSTGGLVTGHTNGSSWILAVSGDARDSVEITVTSPIDCAPQGQMTVPDTVSAAIATTDCLLDGALVDAWGLTVPEMTEITIQLRSSRFDAVLFLLDDSGAFIAANDDGDGGSDSRITITPPAGDYFLYVTSYFGDGTGSYELTTRFGVPPSPCPATAAVAFPDTVAGVTDASGCVLEDFYLDVWRLDIASDTTVVLRVESDAYRPAVVVADTLGEFLDGSGVGPGNSAWLETHLVAGSYDIWLGAREEPAAVGDYVLSVTPGPAMALCGSVGPLSFPGTVDGEITETDCVAYPGRVDPWDLELAESAEIAFSVTTDGFWPAVMISDSMGGVIAIMYGEEDRTELAIPLEAGRYRVWAGSPEDDRGTYTLTARDANQMIPCESEGAIAFEGTAEGALSSTDCVLPDGRYTDLWTTRLDSDTTVHVTVTSDKFDAYLIIADSTGAVIARDDDSGEGFNAALILELPAGLYQLWATSYQPDKVGSYTVAVADAAAMPAQPAPAGTSAEKSAEKSAGAADFAREANLRKGAGLEGVKWSVPDAGARLEPEAAPPGPPGPWRKQKGPK